VERTHSFTIRAYFPPPRTNQKFLPIPSMRSLFIELLKAEPSITVVNPTNKQQIILSHDQIPTTEAEFKKFFTVSMDTRANTKQQHIIVGCHLLSERTIREIKFDKTKKSFLDWLANERVFIESDSLGTARTASIGYLARLHPQHTNKTTLKELLAIAFEDVHLDPSLAVELDPTLKTLQTEAKSNGDMFIPTPPPFELFNTKITHGRDKDKVSSDIIGVKCAVDKMRILKEFFSQLASPTNYEKQIGFFIPTGAVHTIGTQNYAKLISDNDAFVKSVVTIPLGDFQYETLEIPFSLDKKMDIDKTTLLDVITDQPWCLNLGKTSVPNKLIITTTKENLETARKWVDYTLPDLYEENISDKLDVTTLLKLQPRRLDRPILTAASQAYVANLTARASYAQATSNKPEQPPKQTKTRKPHRTEVSFAESDFPPLKNDTKQTTSTNSTITQSTLTTTASTTTANTSAPYDYKAELERLSKEIENNLRPQFDRLFSQMDQKIDALITAREDQEKFNANVTKQLDILVINVTKLLKRSTYQTHDNTQSPRSGDGSL